MKRMNKVTQRENSNPFIAPPKAFKTFESMRIDISQYDLNKESDRRRTFVDNNWRNDYVQVVDLARTGFYYSKRPDYVTCYFCQQTLSEFEPNDDVLKEHLRFSPNCPLLRRRETNNEPMSADELDRALPAASYDVCGSRSRKKSKVEDDLAFPSYRLPSMRLKSFKTWPIGIRQKPETLSAAGFFYSGQSDIAICFCCGMRVASWEEDDCPWVEHKKWQTRECSYLKMNQEILKIHEKKYNELMESKTLIAETRNEEAEPEKNVDHESVCKICLVNRSSILFLPCKHVSVCGQCVFGIDDKCPICRTEITDKITLIYS